MKVYISSLKFSAAHLSSITAYAKLFESLGHEPRFWLHKNYGKMIAGEQISPVIFYPDSFPVDVELALLYNPSTANIAASKKLVEHGAKVFYVYHEPWESFQQYLNEGFGDLLKFTVAHYYSTRTIRYTDLVIVSSNYALNLYNRADIKYNDSVVMIPLLFEDELTSGLDISKKEYFSYIGRAIKGHAFDRYISLIKWIYTSGSNMKFEIATGTDIRKTIRNDAVIQKMISTGALKLSYGRPLSNLEINQAYERSFCVWNVYRRSTQSGVLPKAFMFGTPVIASNIGSFPEFVRDGENGYLVDDYSFESLYKKLILVNENIGIMSQNCRNTFEKTFYWEAQVDKMRRIIENVLK